MTIEPGKVSIVLPTLNGAQYIRQSIDSCLAQTYTNFEIIVVDGGSTDNTLEIVNNYIDPRIKIIHQGKNGGKLPGALNLGFAAAVGEFFTWVQDDDYYTPDAIEVMINRLQNEPDLGLVYTSYWEIDAQGDVIGESILHQPEDIHWTNPVGQCFLYRQSIVSKIGGYDLNYFMAEDIQYWMRVYKSSNMQLIPGRHYYHRLHGGSLTVKNYGRYLARRVAAKGRREIFHQNWFSYQCQVAETYIEEAFAAYSDRDFDRVRSCLIKGVLRNPTWLSNRGVVSIGLKSLLSLSSNV